MTLVDELTTITGIPKKILMKLVATAKFSILQSLEEMILKKDNLCEVDLEIGILLISLEDEELKFKFIPSNSLEKDIIETIQTGKNPMEENIYNNITSALEKTYRELL